ncbi:hypothetical protein SD37_33995 [Amycolatopsis orientalis]|uniref:Uncharacterized protein n=1 Tax=Amycolatopsis orientalis TaxID=31958 RepID=A0A193C6Y7_AMYOR|nr:hypothetical protein [Amycolatopsis orientalis]ANN20123.1 hypothetical protein SD37_33995 [Amycolatopsis orientalis]
MKDILNYVEEKVAALDDHPLFGWLASDETPLKERLMILPTVATVAMGFRDVNKWVLRYPNAANDLERGINIHTFEDQTHSRLFLEDWRRLGLDRRLGWDASDTLWWLFQAEVNEVIRDKCLYFLSIAAADGGDPLLRFAHAEVGELCARELFFKHISAVAGQLAERTGLTMLYFGAHHIEAEGEGAEGVFESVVLDDAHRERARELADVMIGVFSEILDAIHGYVLKHVVTGIPPRPRALEPVAHAVSVPAGRSAVHPTQEPLAELLRERRDRHATHPFYTWIRHRGDRVPAIKALQRFLPLWAMDVMGYADVGRNAFRYAAPSTGLEHAVNDWVAGLTARADGFLRDWKALDLDELLGWDAGDTLEFYYLSRTMDVHRHHRVVLTQLATGHPDPMSRLWLTKALSTATDVFLAGTAVLASEVEAAGELRLDYLSGRSAVAAPDFLGEPVTPDQHDVVAGMIETVFGFLDRQLDLSLDVALSNELRIP